jgi:hypothetical protein
MNNIIWGETHCPFCELPSTGKTEWNEADRLAEMFGDESAEYLAYEKQFCWDWPASECQGYQYPRGETAESARIIDLLRQRDALRAEVHELNRRLHPPCSCPRCTGLPDYYADEAALDAAGEE